MAYPPLAGMELMLHLQDVEVEQERFADRLRAFLPLWDEDEDEDSPAMFRSVRRYVARENLSTQIWPACGMSR